MHYYYGVERSSVSLELSNGKVEELNLSDSEKHDIFVQELDKQMKILEQMEKQK